MLASDLNNREFVNPSNPDDALYVEFFWKEPVLKWQSEVNGKEVRGPRVPFVRIMNPADKTSIYETAVRDDHKARWPQKWLAWQIKNGQAEGHVDLPGWKLDEWKGLKENELIELKHLRFDTVEQIAGASDAQIQRLGIGGIGLRTRAQVALKERNRSEYTAELEKKDKLIADLAARLDKLENQAQPAATTQTTLGLPKGK